MRPRFPTAPACIPDEAGSCSICADEGRIGEVIAVEGEGLGAVGRVRVDGVEEEVALDLLDDVRLGQRILLHLGFAIGRVEES
ncbi:MAG: HypC/HybG/HupF family hydrogenase formation chaperone [Gemmatimonadetes bacterium]|nr:HypC/HybG/HupF family hydrogenase formation chaperone [Gemmatimonadota bacterium]